LGKEINEIRITTNTHSNDEQAPKSILENISYACLKICGSACVCRKRGLKFSIACKICYGASCLNVQAGIIQPNEQSNDTDSDHEKKSREIKKKRKKVNINLLENFKYV